MDTEERTRKFLAGYLRLALRYGVIVDGCDCSLRLVHDRDDIFDQVKDLMKKLFLDYSISVDMEDLIEELALEEVSTD